MFVISDLFRARRAPQSVYMAFPSTERPVKILQLYGLHVLWSSSFARCGRPSARRAAAHAVPLVVEAVLLVADAVSLVLGSRLT
jgi:hypothetical protein